MGTVPPQSESAKPAGQLSGASKTEIVRSFLRREATPHGEYFKSRFIAEEVELSAKEIGATMLKIQSNCPELDVEKWSYTNGTTWRVTLRPEGE